MATDVLVEGRIVDGQGLIDQLVRDGFEVAAAFWARSSDDAPWKLHIASPMVDPENPGRAFRPIYDSLSKITDSNIELSDLKVSNDRHEDAKRAVVLSRRNSTNRVLHYEGKALGKMPVVEAFIYPESLEGIEGIAEIKEYYPTAELFALPVPASKLLDDGNLLFIFNNTNRINKSTLEGKAPGTLLLMGSNASSTRPDGKIVFLYRPEGWNRVFRADTRTWDEVVAADTGKRLYEMADFTPLAALKATP